MEVKSLAKLAKNTMLGVLHFAWDNSLAVESDICFNAMTEAV